jgi:hypothetical protein
MVPTDPQAVQLTPVLKQSHFMILGVSPCLVYMWMLVSAEVLNPLQQNITSLSFSCHCCHLQVALSHGTLYVVDRHDVSGTPPGSLTPQAWPTLVWSQYRLSLSQTKGPRTTCTNTADWGSR